MQEKVLEVLNHLQIPFEKINHPPVNTMDEAEIHWKDIDAIFCKNLFLRDYKGKKHYLVVLPIEKQLDIKWFAQTFEINRPGFASEQRLQKYLGLKPGSVSPFGLINDDSNHVSVTLDSTINEGRNVAFHPNENTSTIILSHPDFIKYMDWVGNDYAFHTL